MNNVNENSSKLVFIETYFNEEKLSTATGFRVNYSTGYLVTNWHVVSGRNYINKKCLHNGAAIPNKLKVKFKNYKNESDYEWIIKEILLYNDKNEQIWYEHPIYGSLVDVVVIPMKLDSNYSHSKDKFNINTQYEIKVGENLFVLGFPLGYVVNNVDEPHAIWTSGKIASDPELNYFIENKSLPAFLIDSRTREGQSGSPVIYYNEIGIDNSFNNQKVIWGKPIMREIGIYSGRINKESDIGVVFKWAVIKEIIDNI